MSTVTFQYSVRDPLGKLHEGSLEAASAEEATQQLHRDGFTIVQLDEEGDVGDFFPRRISRTDVIYATNQLAVMVDTGITLSSALDGIQRQHPNSSFRRVLLDLKNSVESGEDFSIALSRYPRQFDKTYVSLIKVGEATGALGAMLDRITDYLCKEVETRGKVRAALSYPTVMLCMAITVTIFLLTFVMPKFVPLFSRKGMTLPMPTRVMMNISAALTDYWYLWIAGIAALVVGFIFGRRTQPGRRGLDWLKLNTPIFGTLMRKVVISRSIRTLGTMLSNGVNMLDALRLTSEVSGNVYYEQLWKDVYEEVTAGNQICEALTNSPLFPPTLVQMIAAGEQTAQLGPVLERVSNYYDQEVDAALKTTTSMIEPIMISVMGVIVGGIGLSLLLPIFSLSRAPG